MPFWCVQNNECLACRGGCVGYWLKYDAMRERRSAFWKAYDKAYDELSNKEKIVMGHCPQESNQAANTDKLLHREHTADNGWENPHTLSLTQWGGISIDINGYVITKTLKQWHTLAADDFKRQEEMSAQMAKAQAAKPDWPDKWVAMDFSGIEARVVGGIAHDVPVKPPTFARQLTALLNSASKENKSGTPDYILAEYLTNCLGNFEATTKTRDEWLTKTYPTAEIGR